MVEIKKLTVEQYEFMKIYIEPRKTTMINEILLTLSFLDDMEMFELAVECLSLLADMNDDEYFCLSNELKDELDHQQEEEAK